MSDEAKEKLAGPAAVVGPIVHDLARPAAKQIGGTLAGVVRVALSPANFVVWGFDQAVEFAKEKAAEILEARKVPPERVVPPAPEIAGQIVHMLRFAEQDSATRDLYLNLLATAMDRRGRSHPAFVEVIRQLSPDEARLIPTFVAVRGAITMMPMVEVSLTAAADDGHYKVGSGFVLSPSDDASVIPPQSVTNLERLGLLRTQTREALTGFDAKYGVLENHPFIQVAVSQHRAAVIEELKEKPQFTRGSAVVTEFGYDFGMACVSVAETDPAERAKGPRGSST
jgi:hypothetical protein